MNKYLYTVCCAIVAGVVIYGLYIESYIMIDNGFLPKLGFNDVKNAAQIWLAINLSILVFIYGVVLIIIKCVTYIRHQRQFDELDTII